MLLWRFRNRFWIAVALVVADLVIGLFVGERLVRWELEQIREAWGS